MEWNTSLYDNKHQFVSKYGEDLVRVLDAKKGELILDLGSGTGDLATLISQSGANVIGLDSSAEMVNAAKTKYPHIQFDLKSATDFSYDQKFDAIFSNATLHWVLDFKRAIACIYNNLKDGGRFVAEFGGKGNVNNIVKALKKVLTHKGHAEIAEKSVWYFPSLSAYASQLEEAGFCVTFADHFDRPTPLQEEQGMINWLQMFGRPYLENLDGDLVKGILPEAEAVLKSTNYKNGNWYADYVRLRVVAYK